MAQKLDWTTLRPYLTGSALKDLDKFLDALPKRAGLNAVIAAGIMWVVAAGLVLFAATESKKVSELRTEMLAAEALMPPVPVLKEIPVPARNMEDMAKKINTYYEGVTANTTGPGKLTITANTNYYPLFKAAIGHVQSGGTSWKVKVNTLCVGRECGGNKGLQANLKVSVIRVAGADEGKPKLPQKQKNQGG